MLRDLGLQQGTKLTKVAILKDFTFWWRRPMINERNAFLECQSHVLRREGREWEVLGYVVLNGVLGKIIMGG